MTKLFLKSYGLELRRLIHSRSMPD